MTKWRPLTLLAAALALSGCKKDLPAVDEFNRFPRAKGNALSGWTGAAGAATPAMVAERFGQPVRTEDVTGMALPNRLCYYNAKDRAGKPVLVMLRFISVCRPESSQPDCYRLSEVTAASPQ